MRALVAGASSGIGRATAARLVADGHAVTALARRTPDVPGLAAAASVDVGDAAAVRALAAREAAPLDLLVVAAGTNVPRRRLAELAADDVAALLRTNLAGAVHVVTALLPALRAARGLVVLVGSVSGAWPDASGPAYQATKAGLLAFARGAGLEEHEHGVRFTVLAPGAVDTPLLDRRPAPPDPAARAEMLTADDVAGVVAWLAGLPARVHVPELTVLPAALQVLGRT